MLVDGVKIASWEEEILTAWIDEGFRPSPKEPLFIAQDLEGEN